MSKKQAVAVEERFPVLAPGSLGLPNIEPTQFRSSDRPEPVALDPEPTQEVVGTAACAPIVERQYYVRLSEPSLPGLTITATSEEDARYRYRQKLKIRRLDLVPEVKELT